jgi:putative ABC transport system permease protein
MLHRLIQHIRFAIRGFRKQPGFTAVVVVTLALGIGANTAIVSVLNTILAQALPFPESKRLVAIFETVEANGSSISASWVNFRDWEEQQTVFDDMAVFTTTRTLTLTGAEESQRLSANFSSPAYLRMIGAEAVIGRLFAASDNEVPNGHPIVVISGPWP